MGVSWSPLGTPAVVGKSHTSKLASQMRPGKQCVFSRFIWLNGTCNNNTISVSLALSTLFLDVFSIFVHVSNCHQKKVRYFYYLHCTDEETEAQRG